MSSDKISPLKLQILLFFNANQQICDYNETRWSDLDTRITDDAGPKRL